MGLGMTHAILEDFSGGIFSENFSAMVLFSERLLLKSSAATCDFARFLAYYSRVAKRHTEKSHRGIKAHP